MSKYDLEFSTEELLLIRVSLKDRQNFYERVLQKAKQDDDKNAIIVYSASIEDCKRMIDKLRPYTDLLSNTVH